MRHDPAAYRRAAEPWDEYRPHPPEVLDDNEVRALMAACSPVAPSGLRNRALIAILYRGGLRVSEALSLRPKDVDQATGALRILFGKGGRARTAGLDPGALAVLRRWMDARRQWGVNGVHPIFCTRSGRPTTTAYIRRLLPRLGRKAGIEKRVHAHGLRHSRGPTPVRGRGHRDHLEATGAPFDRDDRAVPGPRRAGGGRGGDSSAGVVGHAT